MTSDSRRLENTSERTLDYYNHRAEQFWAGTRDHDVSQNIEAMLHFIEGEPPFTLLDLGCGPGRDLKALTARGHTAIGVEGAAEFAAMACAHSGCEVWQQDFLNLDLPGGRFHGVFANASLFHVPTRALPEVLLRLHACLKPGGVLFSSNPRGHNEEGWSGGRYAVYHISKAGAATSPVRALSSSRTTTAPPASRASNSLGSRRRGGDRQTHRRRATEVGPPRANLHGALGHRGRALLRRRVAAPLRRSQFAFDPDEIVLGDALIVAAKRRRGSALGEAGEFGRRPAVDIYSP
jgi:SAM-dependent methyltransferase